MSALQYKSKIKTPGVELGNEVVLTSPTTGRLNLGTKTETNHTRDNDVLTFNNLLKCSVELVGDGTGAEPSTTENLVITKEIILSKPTKSQNNYLWFSTSYPVEKVKELRLNNQSVGPISDYVVSITSDYVTIIKTTPDSSWGSILNYYDKCTCIVDAKITLNK